MNWMTKAKSRIGRGGKSKNQVENQKRLTAFNKLPSRQASRHPVPLLNAHPQHNVGNRAISGDVMMLGLEPLENSFANPVSAAADVSSSRSRTKPPLQQNKQQAAKKGDDDLLSLHEFTPDKGPTGSILTRIATSSAADHPRVQLKRDREGNQLPPHKSFPLQLPLPVGLPFPRARDSNRRDKCVEPPQATILFFNDGQECDETTGLPLSLTHATVTASASNGQSPSSTSAQGTAVRGMGAASYRHSHPHPHPQQLSSNRQSGYLSETDRIIPPTTAQPTSTSSSSSSSSTSTTSSASSSPQDQGFLVGLTEDNWWSRFLQLTGTLTPLTQSAVLMRFLSHELRVDLSDAVSRVQAGGSPDHVTCTGRGTGRSPKDVLLALYRALNTFKRRSHGNISSAQWRTLTESEEMSLCDAIRFLELADKQLALSDRSHAPSGAGGGRGGGSAGGAYDNGYVLDDVDDDDVTLRMDFTDETDFSRDIGAGADDRYFNHNNSIGTGSSRASSGSGRSEIQEADITAVPMTVAVTDMSGSGSGSGWDLFGGEMKI